MAEDSEDEDKGSEEEAQDSLEEGDFFAVLLQLQSRLLQCLRVKYCASS